MMRKTRTQLVLQPVLSVGSRFAVGAIAFLTSLAMAATAATAENPTSAPDEGEIAVLAYKRARIEVAKLADDPEVARYSRIEWSITAWLGPHVGKAGASFAHSMTRASTPFPELDFDWLGKTVVLGEVVSTDSGLVCKRFWSVAGIPAVNEDFLASERAGRRDALGVRRWAEPERASREFKKAAGETKAVSLVFMLEAARLIENSQESIVHENVLAGILTVMQRRDAPAYVRRTALRWASTVAGDDAGELRMKRALWTALTSAFLDEMKQEAPDVPFAVQLLARLDQDPKGASALDGARREAFTAAVGECVRRSAGEPTLRQQYVVPLATRLVEVVRSSTTKPETE